jgi:2-amino-4-hydroxy-6-hydroxymethyldihydropteridine diphosphokinase
VRTTAVVLGLGSNQGDRRDHLTRGTRELAARVEPTAVSSLYESAPVGFGEQPDFLNLVMVGRTLLSPEALLDFVREVEEAHGRERPFHGAPRTLDVDILFYGDRVIRSELLIVPHPEWTERGFVLAPLLEIAPGWVDPVSGRTVEEVCRGRGPLLSAAREAFPPPSIEENG